MTWTTQQSPETNLENAENTLWQEIQNQDWETMVAIVTLRPYNTEWTTN